MNNGAHCKNCLGTGLDLFNQACPCGVTPGTVGVITIIDPLLPKEPDPTPPIVIEDIKRLVVNPGECLLVKLPEYSTVSYTNSARSTLEQTFPEVKIILYRGDVEFKVVSINRNTCCDNGYLGEQHECSKVCGAV